MRRSAGATLIELMVVVALIGISAGAAGMAVRHEREAGLAELQRELAAQLMEYHAGCLASGRRPDAAALQRLEESLPSARVRVYRRGRLATVTVSWTSMNGLEQRRSLSVFAKGSQ
ncbi:MAG TPA: prepilin-type N-terminal cleavage/methylation domain-containing protein [Myxococcales bacterium]|nr:prepilin-type N-terminal cleavage/methylation domain-containing protein [Myxococcales bacterium]